MSEDQWNFKTLALQGDILYRAESSGADVYDKDYPDISRFDKSGFETDEYILRGLTDGKIDRNIPGGGRGAFTASGTDKEGNPVERGKKIYHGQGGMTPRKSYYKDQYENLKKGWSIEDQSDFSRSTSVYGDKPRYSKSGKLITPYQLFGMYKENTKEMDWKEKGRFTDQFKDMIRNLSTKKPTVDDKAFDTMNKASNK